MLFSGQLVARRIGRSYFRKRVAERRRTSLQNYIGSCKREHSRSTAEEGSFFHVSGHPFIPSSPHYHAGKGRGPDQGSMLTASPPGTHPINSKISQEHIARPTRAP